MTYKCKDISGNNVMFVLLLQERENYFMGLLWCVFFTGFTGSSPLAFPLHQKTPVNLSNMEPISKNFRTELIIQFLKRASGTLQGCWYVHCTFTLLSYLENLFIANSLWHGAQDAIFTAKPFICNSLLNARWRKWEPALLSGVGESVFCWRSYRI